MKFKPTAAKRKTVDKTIKTTLKTITKPRPKTITPTPNWLKPNLHSYNIPLEHQFHLSSHGLCDLRNNKGKTISKSNVTKRVPDNVILWSYCPVGHFINYLKEHTINMLMKNELNQFRKKQLYSLFDEGVFLGPGDEYFDNTIATNVDELIPDIGLYHISLKNSKTINKIVLNPKVMKVSQMLKKYVEPHASKGEICLVVLDCCRIIVGPKRNAENNLKHGHIRKLNNSVKVKRKFLVDQWNLNKSDQELLKQINKLRILEKMKSSQFISKYGYKRTFKKFNFHNI